jgi:serine/threonine protein kinase
MSGPGRNGFANPAPGGVPSSLDPLVPGAYVAPGYRVVAHLSRNQALDVYDVVSEERECRCVAKLVRGDRTDDRAPARLALEAELLLGMTHPNIVRAYELARGPVLIMETLTGATLSALVDEDGPLLAEEIVHLGLHLCSALRYLHRRGWLHLDVKPANVIAEAGRAKLFDLSLARRPGPAPPGLGTREYASPEQIRGDACGPAADVWGLGGTLVRAATGARPFAGFDGEGCRPQLHRRYERSPLDAVLPRTLADAVAGCLEPGPSDRPTLAELRAVLDGHAETPALAA